MSIFHRKSAWERALETVAAVCTARRTAKIGAGVAGAVASLTALSAAVSSARHGDRK